MYTIVMSPGLERNSVAILGNKLVQNSVTRKSRFRVFVNDGRLYIMLLRG